MLFEESEKYTFELIYPCGHILTFPVTKKHEMRVIQDDEEESCPNSTFFNCEFSREIFFYTLLSCKWKIRKQSKIIGEGFCINNTGAKWRLISGIKRQGYANYVFISREGIY
jgi:hypothetical protein